MPKQIYTIAKPGELTVPSPPPNPDGSVNIVERIRVRIPYTNEYVIVDRPIRLHLPHPDNMIVAWWPKNVEIYRKWCWRCLKVMPMTLWPEELTKYYVDRFYPKEWDDLWCSGCGATECDDAGKHLLGLEGFEPPTKRL